MSRFKNQHKKIKPKFNEVIVLGNGPSLGELVSNSKFLERIKTMDSVAVNAFCDHNCFEVVKPKYYVLAAPDYWVDGVKEMYEKIRMSIFNNLARKVSWEMYLFIPWQARKKKFWQEIISSNDNIRIVYFNIVPIEGSVRFKHFCFNNMLGLPRLHNVIGPAIMQMISLNYKTIYLVGVEHSWLPQIHVDDNNFAFVGQPHFYDQDAKPERMNGVNGIGHRTLHEILYKFYLAFRGYFEVQEFAQSRKTKIWNLTPGSFIDAFPRQKIDNFIKINQTSYED